MPAFKTIAQTIQFRSQLLEMPSGVWQETRSVIQDGLGNIWFATGNGLFRFDGFEVSEFGHDPEDQNTISANKVYVVCSGSSGSVWLGYQGMGFSHFNQATGKIQHFKHVAGKSNSLMNDSVTSLLEDSEGFLWIGTVAGVDRFDKNTGKFTHFIADKTEPRSITNGEVYTIYQDKNNALWFGTGTPFSAGKDGGLSRFDKRTQKFDRYLSSDDPKFTDCRVTALFEDSRGNFWVGLAGDGLCQLDRQSGEFKKFPAAAGRITGPGRPPVKTINPTFNDHITFILQDPLGRIWISTCNGIKIFDYDTNESIDFRIVKDDPSNDFDEIMYRGLMSRDGTIWMSQVIGPVHQIDVLHSKINRYSHGLFANTVFEAPGGDYWVGTDGSGLLRVNPVTGKTIKIKTITDPSHKNRSDNVFVIRKAWGDYLWLGTSSGLKLFDQRSGSIRTFSKQAGSPQKINSDTVYSVYQSGNGQWWFSMDHQGLNMFDTVTGKFTQYINNPLRNSSISAGYIAAIAEDVKGRLLAGSFEDGLNIRVSEADSFFHLLRGKAITGLLRDNGGTVWVGTPQMLYTLNKNSDVALPFFNPLSGKAISNILAIVEDSTYNIWIVTGKKLLKLNRDRSVISEFDESSNFFKDQTFIYTDAVTTPGGEVLIGSSSGFYTFYPTKINPGKTAPELVLNTLYINHQLISPGKSSVLDTLLNATKEIHLKYNQNYFSIGFRAMDFSGSKLTYRYRLDPVEAFWQNADEDQDAYFQNLPPGDYTLHVQAINNDGLKSERSLAIMISPPWWLTWWAYFAYALATAALLSAYISYRSRHLKKEKEILEATVVRRTAELNRSLENLKSTQAQLLHSEKMASLGEITSGIAHEIQNPLNFVKNFSEVNTELIQELQQELESGNVDEARRITTEIAENESRVTMHGKRVDGIVKNMLMHSRMGAGRKEPTDVNTIVEEYLKLAWTGFKSKDNNTLIQLQTDYDPSIGKIQMVPGDLGRVLLNVFNNAFYAVREKSTGLSGSNTGDIFKPSVWVTVKRREPYVEIKIRDNGPGITEGNLHKIFQPFFTTKPTGLGTGLGLSVSYDIVKAQNGEIFAESVLGESTTFTIRIPLNDAGDEQPTKPAGA